jgi:hypothetical protein
MRSDLTDTTAVRPARDVSGAVDDISGLARRLPEIDPASYFDGQAREAYRQALVKWPVLARMMKLVARDEVIPQAADEALIK